MEILIISGLSGSGKSRAATYLEDVGYYTVDNLPAEMMLRFADFCAAAGGRYDKLAFVYDVRVGEPPENLTAAVSQLRVRGNRCRLLFLEADTPTIIRRYKETRRSHPLCADGCSIGGEQVADHAHRVAVHDDPRHSGEDRPAYLGLDPAAHCRI